MSKSSHHSLLPVACALALAAAGCSNVAARSGESNAAPPKAPVRVETAPVTLREVPAWLLLTGQLQGSRETDLAANARGRVVSVHVERGQAVKAGQVLVTLDVRAAALNAKTAEADAQTALAQAESAKLECERARALASSGALSTQQVERLEAQCRTSELQVSAARGRARLAAQSVGDAVIRAPFAGVIAERFVEVGEFVQAEARVVTLVDMSTLRLQLTVPEANVAAAEPGKRVRFSVAAYPDRMFGATLKFVSSSVRAGSRDVVAEAIVDSADAASGVLRTGMFAAVQLQTGTTRTPVAPKSALSEREGRTTVFVASRGRLEQRIVQPGESLDGDQVTILRGLAEGEALVTTQDASLKNGQTIL